ncbi:pseudouridine synthase [Fulvivirgaceae bacterium PWU4]|uniref:Pseudouridine synthase n=1 Tax=Chryseosolibacter histidini TaxID=2782349 RepID=A0AAP2DP94_9BACT|nr:pseudouridine synthase [Chryseosolibacter histidini]MBT1699995.1 pseudouridine synthase [Chryseosolibacter histidini]
MAKRNQSGPSSGRRGSSRSNSGEGSFSGRKKSSDKPFRKSDSKRSGTSSFGKSERSGDGRAFKKSGGYGKRGDDSSESGRSYGARKSGYSSGPRRSGEGRGTGKLYGRREDDSSESGGRSYGAGKRNFSSGPRKGGEESGGGRFKKFSGTDSEKPRRRTRDNNSEDRGYNRSDKPYGKRGERSSDSGDRSYGNKKSSFSKDSGGGRFKKFNTVDSDKPSRRRGKDDSGEETSSESRFKKKSFDKPFDRSERGGKPARERRDSSGDEPRGFFKKSKDRYAEKPKGARSAEDVTAPAQTDKIRLNRYIANSGVCSRREADELIKMGLVSVNGKTVTEMGYKVNPGDEVRYENKVLKAEKPVYILMNKPKGFLTTTEDPQERNTVMHIIGNNVKERIYPVGRLDRNTTGLLLLTNDGDLADKLMHPSYNVKKIYKVELDRPLTKADFQKITEGVLLEEGRAVVDDLAIVSEDGKTVGVELHIGWNRVVRRIFESLEYEVVRLDRSVYAGLDKKDLSRGQWRFLSKEEVVRLKHFK